MEISEHIINLTGSRNRSEVRIIYTMNIMLTHLHINFLSERMIILFNGVCLQLVRY